MLNTIKYNISISSGFHKFVNIQLKEITMEDKEKSQWTTQNDMLVCIIVDISIVYVLFKINHGHIVMFIHYKMPHLSQIYN